MKPMVSLTGINRHNFERHFYLCQIFAKANQDFLDLIERAKKDRRQWPILRPIAPDLPHWVVGFKSSVGC